MVLWLHRYFFAPAPVTEIGMNKLRLHLKCDEQADILILATLTFPMMANQDSTAQITSLVVGHYFSFQL